MDISAYLAEQKGVRLNAQQIAGVLSEAKNTLLLAVPGAGKTTVLVSHIAELIINQGISPSRILTVTFNRETAADMTRRYHALFGGLSSEEPTFSTIHSFCLRALRLYARELKREMPRLLDGETGTKAALLRELYKKHNHEFLSEDVYETLEQEIGRAKNLMLPPEEREKIESVPHFAAIFNDYEAFKREKKRMDFDDMLTLTLEVFQKFPQLLLYFQQRYDAVNVDEAQDTSLVQHRILELLSKQTRMFMVGDEDQSIYSFRGAYPQALLEFPERYPDACVIKMEQNFRSRSDLVSSAGRFIAQNRARYPKNMVSALEGNDSIQTVSLYDYAEQYAHAYQFISALPPGKSCGVLYRNNESAIPLMDLFYRAGKPFYVREHKLSFFSSGVILDIAAYLRLAANPADTDAFGQIYYKLGYSQEIYRFACGHAEADGGVFDSILRLDILRDWQRTRTREYRDRFRMLQLARPDAAIDVIETDLNYMSFIDRRLSNGSARAQALQKLNTAKCLAAGLKNGFDFLEKLSVMKEQLLERHLVDSASPIVLSTLHSAKGMEFDYVLLLDALRDIIPQSDALLTCRTGNREAYENEVRLFYVGATRAKERLLLYQSRALNGNPAAPSGFIKDLLEGPAPAEEGRILHPGDEGMPLAGKRVRHTQFGQGVVSVQEKGAVTVLFDEGGQRTLDLSVCLRRGMLALCEGKK